ncbi:hypothetical protein NQ314_004308 [Rhamnusium bicolor]|uniref:C2 domain-containing protein n=1 Tax=Rhamnusium bicolor TaxID=1586634 RepID=A0AAV8ZK86_9CUCU|nr:hypothetical protein NQ314_004308 [Rhamnusium bicolor]
MIPFFLNQTKTNTHILNQATAPGTVKPLRVLISGIIYFIGYMNWSITWIIIPVILGIFNDERKKKHLKRRNMIRKAALGKEQDIILANIAELPAWVYFPDVERAEWINKIIKQLWPNVNHYVHDLIKDTIEDKLKINLEKYALKGFKFQRIILGSVPFRIGGVIVYDNVFRDEIVMDLDVSYAGDCDIKFRLRGLNGGIKNFQQAACKYFFLNNPEIDFDLDGIAGILEIPGVNELLKKSIIDTVSSVMVLPNKFPIQLHKEVRGEQLKTPNPAFIILEFSGQQMNIHVWDQDATDDEFLGRITIDTSNLIKVGQSDLWLNLEEVKHGKIHIRCTWMSLSTDYSDLQAAIYETQQLQLTYMNTALLIVFVDSATSLPQVKTSSKPDPYVHIQIGKQVKHTRTIMRTVNPVWEEGFIFFVSNPDSESLDLKIVDTKTDQELCLLSYNISNLSNKENLEIVQQPFRLFKGTPDSKIEWSLHLKILKNENLEEYIEDFLGDRRQSNSSNTSKIHLEKQNSDASLFPNNSTAEELFDRTSKSSTRSSTNTRRSRSISKSSEEQFIGQINLTLRYSVQRQRLIVVVHSLSNIPYKDQTLRNLYVKLYLLPERNKDGKRKTCVKNFDNPTYDESFDYLISQGELNTKKLEVSVIEEKMVKNFVLGQVIVDLSKLDVFKTHTDWFELTPHLKRD